ncbi:tyrosine-type recombinase/integrase [Aeromonas caviae]
METRLDHRRSACSNFINKVRSRPEWGRGIWKRIGHSAPWTWHDLRRSLATRLNEAGIAPHVVEQILGHALPGVMAHYVHTVRLPEQKMALELWGGILKPSLKQEDNIVHLQVR